MKRAFCFLIICGFSGFVASADPIATFANETLKIDLDFIEFGSPFPATNQLWLTNATTEKYEAEFPERSITYGYQAGKLDALKVSLSTISHNFPSKDILLTRQKTLKQILEKFYAAKKENQPERKYHVEYNVTCSSVENDLFFFTLTISPSTNKPPSVGISLKPLKN